MISAWAFLLDPAWPTEPVGIAQPATWRIRSRPAGLQ
jgi:hypothetical protein